MSPLTSSSPISCVELCKHSARPPGRGVRGAPRNLCSPREAQTDGRTGPRSRTTQDDRQTARGLGVTIGAAGPRAQQSLPAPPAGCQREGPARRPGPDDAFPPWRLPRAELCHRVISQTRLREEPPVHRQPAVGRWQTQGTTALTQLPAPGAVGATARSLLPPPSSPLRPGCR